MCIGHRIRSCVIFYIRICVCCLFSVCSDRCRRCRIPCACLVARIRLFSRCRNACKCSSSVCCVVTVLHQCYIDFDSILSVIVPCSVDYLEGDLLLVLVRYSVIVVILSELGCVCRICKQFAVRALVQVVLCKFLAQVLAVFDRAKQLVVLIVPSVERIAVFCCCGRAGDRSLAQHLITLACRVCASVAVVCIGHRIRSCLIWLPDCIEYIISSR